MPTYEFRCPLGHEFEIFYRSISRAEAQAACPQCGQLAERMMSAGAGLVFKGSGFYLTDYGKNAHRERGTVEAKSDGSKGDGSNGQGKGESSKSESGSSGGESSNAASSDGGKGDSKQGDAKQSDSKQGDTKQGDSKKSDAKSVESKPAAAPPKPSAGE
ncbi:MAG: regulatory protein FmdB family [Gemmatimonadetes bacterium]|nr:regulatory protein FmdB family [Gemmatimonadota bacterium]